MSKTFLSDLMDRLTFQTLKGNNSGEERGSREERGVEVKTRDEMKDNILACRPRGMTTNTQ